MSANTAIVLPPWILPIRLAQAVISVLVLIFTIIPIALWGGYYSFGLGIFTCLATFGITGYWYFASKKRPTIYNRWVVLGFECWAVLWWLVSFSTLATLASAFDDIAQVDEIVGVSDANVNTSKVLIGLAAFLGAVEFVLFIITLVVFSTRLHRQRQTEMMSAYNGNVDMGRAQMYNGNNNNNQAQGGNGKPYPLAETQPV